MAWNSLLGTVRDFYEMLVSVCNATEMLRDFALDINLMLTLTYCLGQWLSC